MTIKYKSASIEQERDGSWSIFWTGNPYATVSGMKSVEAAKARIEQAS